MTRGRTMTAAVLFAFALVACAEIIGLAPYDEGPDLTDAAPDVLPEGGADAEAGVDLCSNDVQDPNETDVDCGGVCGKCSIGKKCKADTDCANACIGGFCSGCHDGGVELDGGAEAGCVDSTEVRVKDYAAFLANPPSSAGRDDRCRDAGLVPGGWNEQLARPELPVRRVDWCSARAYCKRRGQNLCGALPGAGPIVGNDFFDPLKDQWIAACTGQERTVFPYGPVYNDQRCNGADKALGEPWIPGSGVDCKTVGLALFDMSGNVAEWEDACELVDGREQCRIRGGSYASDAGFLKCAADERRPPDHRGDDVGFRCCE